MNDKPMNKYSKLIKNSGIFFISTFGSKILSFLLVPFYTNILSTEEYGTTDIIITTAAILIPIITLSISEACLRFAMDEQTENSNVLINGLTVLGIGNMVFVLFYPLILQFESISQYTVFLYLIIISSSIHTSISQYCRGIGKIKEFAIGGVISTVALIASNIILLLVVKLGIKGYLISVTMSYVIPSVYYCCCLKDNKLLVKPNKALMKAMLIYSIPMIPNALSWWAMQASDKYILIFFAGVSANGIYVIAHKMPTIINTVSGIFMKSWQISAVDESNSDTKTQFFSRVYEYLLGLLLLSTSAIMVILRPLFSVWVADSYYIAWKYTPILLFANVFSSMATFVGTNYMAMKRTTGNLKTTLIGCICNVILNLIFIPRYGIYAASATTCFSFLITWIVRVYDTRDFVRYIIDIKRLIIVIVICCIQYIVLVLNFTIIAQIPLFAVCVFMYRKEFVTIVLKIIKGKERL